MKPNATRQARREAGAQRTLYAVACTRWFGALSASMSAWNAPTRKHLWSLTPRRLPARWPHRPRVMHGSAG